MLGWTDVSNDFPSVYWFDSIHKSHANGAHVVALDAGWTNLRPLYDDSVEIKARLDTIAVSATSYRVRLTAESVNGDILWQPSCGGAGLSAGPHIAGVKLQVVDSPFADESRKFDLPGATQLRSIKSRLFRLSDGAEVLLDYDPANPLATLTNIGLSPFFLSDGFAGPNGDVKVFVNPNDISDPDFAGYRLVGTPNDVTVDANDPGNPDYPGVVLHLFNACDLNAAGIFINRFEIDFLFDTEPVGDQNGDKIIDDSEYTALFAGMPAADPGPSTGGLLSLFDGMTAQTNLYPIGSGTPSAGGGIDSFMLEETGSRDAFYSSGPGFLNTLGESFTDVIQQMLEATGQMSRVRLLPIEETYELIRFQAGYMIFEDIEFLEIDFADSMPTMKARFVGDVEFGYIEVWQERYTNHSRIYEFNDIPVSDFGAAGQRLRQFFQIAKEVQTGLGMVLGIYDVTSGACTTLDDWAEIYRPGNEFGFCVQACQSWFDTFQSSAGIFSTAFGNWGGGRCSCSPQRIAQIHVTII